MTDSDELMSKLDALLARGRSGTVAPRPPSDYPVLTEVIWSPAAKSDVPLPEPPSESEIPLIQAPASTLDAAESTEDPVLYSPGEPTFSAQPAPEATDARLAMPGDYAELPTLLLHAEVPDTGEGGEEAPDAAEGDAEATAQALEERVYLRVLEAIEPYVGAIIEEPLRLRIEELARDIATAIARDARDDILTLVREAVRSAVAHELDARRSE